MSLHLVALLSPAVLLIPAGLGWVSPGRRPAVLLRVAETACLAAILGALASAAVLASVGPATSPLLGVSGGGLSVRLDLVSVTMLVLVAFIGWVVLRYSASYLDGEARQGAFVGWMAATLASVLLLVQSGNLAQLCLAWIATSLSLHRLLLFYPERPQAVRAARKKFVVARAGDAALIGAAARIDAMSPVP
jgi:NAD(P)H-quinone oxidoreductase subunit 5